jgi:hypothetical protein
MKQWWILDIDTGEFRAWNKERKSDEFNTYVHVVEKAEYDKLEAALEIVFRTVEKNYPFIREVKTNLDIP